MKWPQPTRSSAARGTVWALGAEGEKLDAFAQDFNAENPGVKVKVTPIARDGAHDKILTSIAGKQTPDVAGSAGPGWASSPRPARWTRSPTSIDMGQFFQGALDAVIVDGKAYGVPWHVETRVLYYRTDIAEKAGVTDRAEDLGRAQGDGHGDEGEGRREARHVLSAEQLAGVGAVRVAERRRDRRRRAATRSTAPEAVEATAFYKSFFDEGLTRRGPPQGFDIDARVRRAARTRCSSAARGTWA